MESMTVREHFEQRLTDFINGLQLKIANYYNEQYPQLVAIGMMPKISMERGKRYIRVVRSDKSSQSVHCFIDTNEKQFGAVLKAAGWKTPAKGIRSNIFDHSNGLDGVTVHGAVYH